MVNIIVWNSSVSWWKQFRKWIPQRPWDIWTSRKNIINTEWEVTEPWLNLADVNKIKEWVGRIIESWNLIIKIYGEINIFFHAMNLMWVSKYYPSIFINYLVRRLAEKKLKFQYGLDESEEIDYSKLESAMDEISKKINATLISFHEEYSDENPDGSHVSYLARWPKKNMEQSLQFSHANKKLIYDLEIFDSPSWEKIWYPFLWAVWQFINFLEANPQLKYKKLLQKFLWKDYRKFLDFFDKYPLSWKLEEWQKSMNDMELWEYKSVLNTFVSSINSAKLAYLSWAISELYVSLSMDYLNNNIDTIFDWNNNRKLATWEEVFSEVNITKNQPRDWIKEKYWVAFNQIEERLDYKNLDEEWTKTNLLFVENDVRIKSGEKGLITEVDYEFNPTEKNFDIIGNSEVWWHFWRVPLFMLNWVIYNSSIIWRGEYISSTKPDCILSVWKKFTIRREWNNITVFNTYSPSEVFAEIKVNETKVWLESEVSKDWWIKIPSTIRKPIKELDYKKLFTLTEREKTVYKTEDIYDNSISLDCEFNDSPENIELIAWWQEHVVSSIEWIWIDIQEWIIYNSWLVENDEVISLTNELNDLLTSDNFIIKRVWNTIVIFDKYSRDDVYSTFIVRKEKEYEEWVIPHWKWWFDKFSQGKIPSDVFGLNVDPRATIIEVVWFEVAKAYFINPNEDDVKNLREKFNRITDFSNLNWVFSKVDMKEISNEFKERIRTANLEYYIVQSKTAAWKLTLTVDVFDWEHRMCQLYYAVS